MGYEHWIRVTDSLPGEDLGSFEVTLETPCGMRTINVAIYYRVKNEWEMMIDKHHFYDCKVIAWKHRTPPLLG